MTTSDRILEKAQQINTVIEQFLPKEEGKQKVLLEAMNYTMKGGGKRIRPMLMQETYRLFGGKETVIEPFMVAIEMIHTYSLIHDDLPALDNDDYRRGRKTAHVVYGEDIAILSGDGLLNYAFEVAAKAFCLTVHQDRVGRAIGILAEKTGIYGMIGGQTVDVELTGKPVPEDKLDFIYRLKTGALLEASMMIGAVLAGASEDTVKKCGEVALKVGLAFQIQDDILDLTSSTEELGKPVLSDEKNNKTTYVTIYGMEAARKQVAELSRQAVETLHEVSGENPFLEQLILSLVNRLK